jgi:spermidine/putrescine transport system permease protein
MSRISLIPRSGRDAAKRRVLLEKYTLLGPGLAYLALFMAVPVLLILALTIFQRGVYGGIVYHPTFDNFTRAIDSLYLDILRNSLVIAGITTLLAALIGYPTAYAIAQLSKRWRTLALVLVVLPFWTNFLIRTYAWIVLLNSQGPLNKALEAIGLSPFKILYTQTAVIAGLLYSYLPLMILPLYASIERLDPELREASANLGASNFRTFISLTIPLTLPGLITGSIFVFVPSLGNFVVPELLGGGKTVMVGNLIRDQFLKARDWPFGAVLALAVILFLVMLFALQSWVSRRIAGPVKSNA